MTLGSQFERAKALLLSDESICPENRKLFREFFEFEERKLKRMNGLSRLDDACYRTLYGYIHKFRNVNRWFADKPWVDLTKEDIRRVYDDLEDGVILNRKGTRYKDRLSYYNKIFRSQPFRMAGKSEHAKEVIEFVIPNKSEVRFVPEATVRLIASVLSKPQQLLLVWLAWDIGENIGALLQLEPMDFTRRENSHTQRPEYLINLPDRKIKRSRQSRSELTLYDETVQLLDVVLRDSVEGEPIFGFGLRQAEKFLEAAVRKTGSSAKPGGQPVRWKDLRSGMACHLLRMGWTRDEVNARLGHTPNSSALDAYINYLALDRVRPKEKLETATLEGVRRELKQSRQQANLLSERVRRQAEGCQMLKRELARARDEIVQIRGEVSKILRLLRSNGSPGMTTSVQDSCSVVASPPHGRVGNR